MKVDVRKLYPDENECGWFCVCDYDPMVEAFGNVAIKEDVGSYQGDTLVLYDNDGRIGFLVFGWGSCTVCDALQACDNMDEVQKLCDELQRDIKWFNSKDEALKWVKGKDWETEWYWHHFDAQEFIKKVIDYLSK